MGWGEGATSTVMSPVDACAFASPVGSCAIASIWPESSAFRRAVLSTIETTLSESTYGLPVTQ